MTATLVDDLTAVRERTLAARRAGFGHRGQEPPAPAGDGRRGHAAPLRPARRHRGDDPAHGLRARRRAPGPGRARDRRRLRTPSGPRPRAAGRPARRRVPRRHGRELPAGPRPRLLRQIARLLRPGEDWLLLGTDLVKDPAVLEAAYDDGPGVTAEFNGNLLRVVNRELDADFEVEDFEHVAFFDREREWIEMRRRACRRMRVGVGALGLDVEFAPREELRTEISAKFTPERLAGDLTAAGLALGDVLTDPDGLFALSLSTPRTRRRST